MNGEYKSYVIFTDNITDHVSSMTFINNLFTDLQYPSQFENPPSNVIHWRQQNKNEIMDLDTILMRFIKQDPSFYHLRSFLIRVRR